MLRVVFTTGGNSGMAAMAVCEEQIEPVGFLLDSGPLRLTKRSQPPRVRSIQRAWMFARLAARFPEYFMPIIYRKAGISTLPEYDRLRKREQELADEIVSQCGEDYRQLLNAGLRRFPTFREVSAHYGSPFKEVANINSDESAAVLRSWRPDVIVSLGNRIVKPHILAIPRLGVLNGHSSLLPRYRGTATEFWQLANGETHTGVTIHWMASRVDEGAVLVQEKWPILPGANHWQLRAVSQFLRLPLWRKAIHLAAAGDPGRPQGESDQPTFGTPHLSDLYAYYIAKKPPRRCHAG